MIEQLIIKGYKSIQQAYVPMKRLNVLSGLNSSGKSSIIQCLRILDRIARKKDNVLLEELGGEKDVRNKLEGSMDITAVYGENGERSIKYSALKEDYADFPKVIYVGADRIGPRDTYKSNKTNEMDPQGENVLRCIEHYSMFADSLPQQVVPEDSEGEAFRFVVQGWLKKVSPGVKFNVEKIQGLDAYKATYNDFSPYNVGYGLSYSLSIIVAILIGVVEKNSIVLLENPEAHIHAKGQTAFAELICGAVEAGAQIVVETHSDHVFDGVRVYAKEHEGFADKTNVMWFKLVGDDVGTENTAHTSIEYPTLDNNGRLDFWPEDMYDQFMSISSRLL